MIRLALAASFLLLIAAPSAQAIPNCDLAPELCEPPIDPCDENPQHPSCIDVEPPIDPCVLNPEECEPDPCEADPASCEPEPEPEPEEDPLPEQPVAEYAELTGTAKVKGKGFNQPFAYAVQLSFDDVGFMAVAGTCDVYTGQLVAKGKKGTKFRLFLDGPSSDQHEADVATMAAGASARTAGAVMGASSKIILKVPGDGSVLLKIKSVMLVDGIGEVVFKARVSGLLATGALPKSAARCL